MGEDRRALLRRGLAFAGGVAAGLSADRLSDEVGPDRLPLSGGYASGGVASARDPRLQAQTVRRRGVRKRIARHELGNHTWAHHDLARLDEEQVRDQILRTHVAIKRVTGETTTLMRPPWGHLGGSTLVIAEEFGYDVVMWSHQMHEDRYKADPPAQARDIVDNVGLGSIVLAHDVGKAKRLVALSRLDAIIVGLQRRGLKPVTVSELLAAASVPGRQA